MLAIKTVKWGVIGCGGIADRRTIPGMMLSDKIELVAVMNPSLPVAERIKEKYNAKYAFSAYEELLALDEIEAVYIASPLFCHYEQAVAAARAKKHVLLEKPMALTFSEAEEIRLACEENGVKLGIGFLMRFHAYHRKMKEIIAEGKIGEVVSVRGQFTCWYPDIEGAWRQDKKLSGGGALMDMGIHVIDLIQYVTGLKVCKVMSFNESNSFNYTVEDTSGVLMKMNNGAISYVDSNFNIPDAVSVSKLEIYGTRGSLIAHGTLAQAEVGKLEVLVSDDSLKYDASQNRSAVVPLDVSDIKIGENLYKKEVEAFVDAILNGTNVPVTADSAIFTQKVVDAAYKSSETGKMIVL